MLKMSIIVQIFLTRSMFWFELYSYT